MGDCACNSGVKLIYSCSGNADVGEISDRAARALRREGFGQGSCIAGIGAGIAGYIQSAKGADVNIAIDGCPVACARKILENIGITPESYIVTEMGFKKGGTHVTPEAIEAVYNNVKAGKKGEQKTVISGGGCG
jgi:uncharacterized metal-binding protein